MLPLNEILLNWADELENYKLPDWNMLPDIDLYMDQVITYLERQLAIYSQSDEEKLVTPAMINNYVKSEVIPRPVQKKYAKEHLVHLMAVLNLKQVLSLSDISKLVKSETIASPVENLLNQFNSIQHETLKSTSKRVKDVIKNLDNNPSDNEIEKELSILALSLSLEANANRIMAKRILDEIMKRKQTSQEEKEKDKSSNKEKVANKVKDKDK